MGRVISSVRHDEPELARERSLLRRKTAKQFTRLAVAELQTRCVILFGSTAKGTDGLDSDVDVIVIGGQLPADYFARGIRVNRLRPKRGAPMNVFAYSEDEFERMLANCHVTALDAMYEGIPLYGKRYFNRLKRKFDDLVKAGWRRTRAAWIRVPEGN